MNTNDSQPTRKGMDPTEHSLITAVIGGDFATDAEPDVHITHEEALSVVFEARDDDNGDKALALLSAESESALAAELRRAAEALEGSGSGHSGTGQ